MLSDLEVGQFWTFGFTVLRGCLSEKEVERLQGAHSRVIADAPVYNYFAENGTRMLGPFVQADDAFTDLIEHPGVMEAMCDIWGTECLYIAGSDMWANRDDTPWHTDGQPGRHNTTLKSAIYLDEQSEDFGSLNLIPGSHHPEYSASLFRSCGYWDRGRPRLRLDPHAIYLSPRPAKRPANLFIADTTQVKQGRNRIAQAVIDQAKNVLATGKKCYIFCDERRSAQIIAAHFGDKALLYDAYHKNSPDIAELHRLQRLPDDKDVLITTTAVDVGVSFHDENAETIVFNVQNPITNGLSSTVQQCLRNRTKPRSQSIC